MVTITVTGALRPPDYIKEKLVEVRTVKDWIERKKANAARLSSLRREIDELESERDELEEEGPWLDGLLQQIIDENPEEAEAWARHKALTNPNQMRLKV